MEAEDRRSSFLLPATFDDIRDRSVARFLVALLSFLKFNILYMRPIGLSIIRWRVRLRHSAMLSPQSEAAGLMEQAAAKCAGNGDRGRSDSKTAVLRANRRRV